MVIGILNLIFAVIYAIVFVAAFSSIAELSDSYGHDSDFTLLIVAGYIVTGLHAVVSLCLGIGGFHLINYRTAGVKWTGIARTSVLISVTVDLLAALITAISMELNISAICGSIFLGLMLRAAYPVIASSVISSQQMDLHD
jgi:hypothetical protein